MKKLLLGTAALVAFASGTAFAADLPPAPAPIRAPVAYIPPPPPFSWTGFYIGGNAGAGWNRGNVSDTFYGLNWSNSSNNAVFIGGGQIGGNYQINALVVGLEGALDWAANNNNAGPAVLIPTIGAGTQTVQVTSNNRWITTLAARFGVAFDRALVYA